jgi:hypothetical protein
MVMTLRSGNSPLCIVFFSLRAGSSRGSGLALTVGTFGPQQIYLTCT